MTVLDLWKSNEGLNDTQAAELLGISRGFFTKLRHEQAPPSVQLLIRMRRITGLSFDQLLGKWVERDALQHAEAHASGAQLPLPQLQTGSGIAA